MNRTSFTAAIAAILCSALVACGGGGGSSDSVPVTPPTQTNSDSGVGTGGTGQVNSGNNGSNQANDGQTIPGCTPKTQVLVALQGDDQMTDFYNTGVIQKAMDDHFGGGHVLVDRYTTGPEGVNSALYIAGDVRVENYGMWDMMAGEAIDYYMTGLTTYLHPTLIVTQSPIISPYFNDTPYVVGALGVASANNIATADVNAYVKSQDTWQNMVQSDGIRLKPEAAAQVALAVLVPAIQAQVAPLRCLVK